MRQLLLCSLFVVGIGGLGIEGVHTQIAAGAEIAQSQQLKTYAFKLQDKNGRTSTVYIQARDTAEALGTVRRQYRGYQILSGPTLTK